MATTTNGKTSVRTGRKLPQVITAEQAKRLLALPSRRYPTGRRNHALLSMLYLPTCLRISEALALKVRDVNLTEGTGPSVAGLPFRLHPHTLRHAGASELLRRGFTLADVQRPLRHSNVATTSIYLHVFDGDSAAKVKRLGTA